MRGYAGSDIPQGVEGYLMEKLVDDIRDAILKLGYEKAVVMAHDWCVYIIVCQRTVRVEQLSPYQY